MLLSHIGTKDHLVAAVLRDSNDRAVATISALATAPEPARRVHDLWSVVRSPEFEPRTRLYIDVAFMAFLLDAPRAVVDLADAVAPWADDQPCLTRV